jgi:hypothetical protein
MVGRTLGCEQGEAAIGIGDLLGSAGELRVSLPLGRVDRSAVEREAWVTTQIVL